ncbi:uncharacterized protein METZ01_LOCUS189358, partial [marine metagenome]
MLISFNQYKFTTKIKDIPIVESIIATKMAHQVKEIP